ncbi:MAG: hypothetical protein ACLTSZ_03885 [Lachnospiraceae bacterium]
MYALRSTMRLIPNKCWLLSRKIASQIPLASIWLHIDMTQARIAETRSMRTLPSFFNGGVEEPNKGEDRILVKSRR